MSEDFKTISWPGWETVGLIGRGSFGAVYKIERKVFNDTENAALKVISIPQNNGDIEELYSDGYDDESITSTFQSHLESIVAEYSLMRKMNGSANIVNCDDVRYVQHDDGIGWDIFIKMELLTPLTKALPSEVSDETVIKLAKDMCRALILCKKHGIVHRDIKPQNIFVSEHGDYKLGDFGIAKTVEKTTGGTKIGTYKYMAPEVYNNQPYGSSADIYSLGLVLYWLLNKRRMPFLPLPPAKLKAGQDEDARHRRLSGEPIPEPICGSKELKRIVLKACAYEIDSRYSSAEFMLEDLDRLTGELISSDNVISQGNIDTAPQEEDLTMGPSFGTFKHDIEEKDSQQNAVYDEPEDDATMGPAFNSDPIGTEECVSSGEDQNKRSLFIKYAFMAFGAIAAIIIIILLFRSCSGRTPVSTDGTTNTQESTSSTTENTTDDSTEGSTGGPQLDWTDWLDELPANITDADYEIEEQTLYRSRTQETTNSTTQNSMEGWELYHTANGNGDYGSWSSWSTQKVTASDTRDVQTQQQYRYRTKETSTSSSSTKSGWELYNTTYSWGNYGNWSGWSTTAASKSDSRNVETKTQYRYRNISYSTEYTSWSSWSSWSSTRQSTSDLKKEESRTVWAYAYFLCPNCGAHMHGYGQCWTWAGGCGASTSAGHWVEVWSTTSWDNAGLRDWHGTGKYYAYIDGQLVFKWPEGGSHTEYRYATRSIKQVPNYGSWSGWGDTAYSNSSTREVQTQKVYRYQDRSQIPTYHFWRWGSWSGWSTDSVSETNDRDVETATHYRYRDRTTETTYYFRRWSEWSEFSATEVSPSDTIEVETKTQYRYKSKTN